MRADGRSVTTMGADRKQTSGGAGLSAPASSLQREIQAEQEFVDRVYKRWEELRADADRMERDGYRLLEIGHEGALVERDAFVYHAALRRRLLDAGYDGLVFGRLDLRDSTTRYIGRIGIRDVDATPMVVDWRAPAAAAFYRATPVEPGDVVRRRHIVTSDGVVVRLDDELLDPEAAPGSMPVVGDGAMLAQLRRPTGHEMRDIVATIQREQDEIVRAPATGVTVVEGGPGTGKTAVALHRVAYLLYSDRERFTRRGVLVVGPSSVFVRYISAVLPSLGEEAAVLRSLGEMVDGVVATRSDPPDLAVLKGSLRMAEVLRRAARARAPQAPRTLSLPWGRTMLRVEEDVLERIQRRALEQDKPRNHVRGVAFDGVLEALFEDARSHGYAGTREAFEDTMIEREDFRSFLKRWMPLLTPMHVFRWLADPERLAGWGAGVLSDAEVEALAAGVATSLGQGFTVADIALLDELDELLGEIRRPKPQPRNPYEVAPGVHEVTTFADRQRALRAGEEPDARYRGYAHVVVDEAQDLSPMQWRMLGRRGAHASWTVVGDPAQSWLAHDPAEVERARREALGRREVRTYRLSTNYRNPAEIFELAAAQVRGILPDALLPTPVRKTGAEPVELRVPGEELSAAVRDAVRDLLRAVEGTVGVIVPDDRHEEVSDLLAGEDARVQVVTALAAKGMEYDGVVVVEPSRLRERYGPGCLYVAYSRPTERLVVVDVR